MHGRSFEVTVCKTDGVSVKQGSTVEVCFSVRKHWKRSYLTCESPPEKNSGCKTGCSNPGEIRRQIVINNHRITHFTLLNPYILISAAWYLRNVNFRTFLVISESNGPPERNGPIENTIATSPCRSNSLVFHCTSNEKERTEVTLCLFLVCVHHYFFFFNYSSILASRK